MDQSSIDNSKQAILHKISELQKEIANKKVNKGIQIGIFFLTTCIMLFFLTFFILDLVNILRIYLRKQNNIKVKEDFYKVDDNNRFDISGIEYENEMDMIEDQISKRNINLENRLKEMIEWKRSNKIPSGNIENRIDMTVVEEKHDNYKYNNKSNGDSFWKMLFMPPKYYDLVNNKAKPFFRWMHNT